MDYKVQLDVFEGPLDLLLYLIKKEEVDIYEVNLTKIATQFIEYVELMRELDLDIAGEFLVMAATLMFIKSRELLPLDQQVVADEEEEDVVDPRWELIRQLVEYKKFKDAALRLQEREGFLDHTYSRHPARPDFTIAEPQAKPSVSVFDLLKAVSHVLNRFQERDTSREIFQDRWTVSDKIEQIRTRIQSQKKFRFTELFLDATNRMEVVVTFLALLELIRLRQIAASQPEPFSEIEIIRVDSSPPEGFAGPEAGSGQKDMHMEMDNERDQYPPPQRMENTNPLPEDQAPS